MSAKTILMDDQLLEYLRQNSVREPDVLQELREETQKLSMQNQIIITTTTQIKAAACQKWRQYHTFEPQNHFY